nr:uncharacterized protein LOC118051280 [Populus alba]
MSASKESSYRLYIVLAGTLWCFYHPWQWPFVISLSSRFLTGAVAFRREKGFFLFFFCLCLINLPSIWQFWLGLARSYTHSFFFFFLVTGSPAQFLLVKGVFLEFWLQIFVQIFVSFSFLFSPLTMNIEVAVGRNNMTPRDSTYKFPSDSTLEHSLDRYVPAEYIIHENRRGKNSARFKCTLIFIMWWTRVFCRGSSDCEFLCSCVFVTSDGDMECLSEYVVVCWGDNAWQLGHLLLLSHFRSSVFTSQYVLIVICCFRSRFEPCCNF